MTSLRSTLPHEAAMLRRHRNVLRLPEDDAVIDAMPEDQRRDVAQTWHRRAREELRAAAGFSLFCNELLALGGEPELLAEVSRAVHDEVRHAEVCRALASRYARTELPWPGHVDVDPIPPKSHPHLRAAYHVVRLCCVTEALASAFLETSLANARSPSARAAVGELLADEVLHSRAGWTFLAKQSPATMRAIDADLLRLIQPAIQCWWDQGNVTLVEGAPEHGIPSLAATQACIVNATRTIVIPGFASLGLDVAPLESWLVTLSAGDSAGAVP